MKLPIANEVEIDKIRTYNICECTDQFIVDAVNAEDCVKLEGGIVNIEKLHTKLTVSEPHQDHAPRDVR